MSSLRFVVRVAAGPLEAQAVLLCRSIRRFGGAQREAPISVVGLPTAFEDELAALGAERSALEWEDEELPMANKVLAGAQVEARCAEDIIVFLDSDSLLVAEPAELLLGPEHVAAVRPVNASRLASTGPGHPQEPFWEGVYELCDVAPPPFVHSTVGGERIRAYWNSGLVATRRSAGLFAAWRRDLETLLAARHVPPKGTINQMDQVALTAALARVADAVLVLDGRYNYPLPRRDRLAEPLCNARLADLVHVHYFRSLHEPGYLDAFEPDEVVRWLAPQLPLAPVEYARAKRPVYRLGGGSPS